MANKTPSPVAYRRAVVTFIDILGFRELVKDGDASKVKRALDTVARFASENSQEHDEFSPRSIAFSDCIVRARFLDGANEEEPMGLPFLEMLSMVQAQVELVQYDVILRGAITVGDIHLDGPTVFGPALVRAYELESKVALYPRIVVDPNLLNATKTDRMLGSTSNNVKEDRQHIRNMLARGDNGFWFVDYLTTGMRTEQDDPSLGLTVLRNHKKLVLSRYASPARTTALDKILWLARYHNSVVESLKPRWFKTHGVSKGVLEITTKEVAELARLPRRTRDLVAE